MRNQFLRSNYPMTQVCHKIGMNAWRFSRKSGELWSRLVLNFHLNYTNRKWKAKTQTKALSLKLERGRSVISEKSKLPHAWFLCVWVRKWLSDRRNPNQWALVLLPLPVGSDKATSSSLTRPFIHPFAHWAIEACQRSGWISSIIVAFLMVGVHPHPFTHPPTHLHYSHWLSSLTSFGALIAWMCLFAFTGESNRLRAKVLSLCLKNILFKQQFDFYIFSTMLWSRIGIFFKNQSHVLLLSFYWFCVAATPVTWLWIDSRVIHFSPLLTAPLAGCVFFYRLSRGHLLPSCAAFYLFVLTLNHKRNGSRWQQNAPLVMLQRTTCRMRDCISINPFAHCFCLRKEV